jgi:hypothetical protein
MSQPVRPFTNIHGHLITVTVTSLLVLEVQAVQGLQYRLNVVENESFTKELAKANECVHIPYVFPFSASDGPAACLCRKEEELAISHSVMISFQQFQFACASCNLGMNMSHATRRVRDGDSTQRDTLKTLSPLSTCLEAADDKNQLFASTGQLGIRRPK